MVMEKFSGILFHKSGPANKQHTNQSINYSWYLFTDRALRFHLKMHKTDLDT